MPRPAKPSLYRRGGLWHYRFTVAGERHRGPTGEGDRAAAQAKLAAIWHEAHRTAGRPVPRGPAAQLDLTDLAGLWLADLEQRAGERNPRYVERHRQAVKHATEAFVLPSEVTNDRWQEAMRTAHGPATTWRTLQVATYSLRMLLRFAKAHGAIAVVPELVPPDRRALAREASPRRALTREELQRVLKAMRQGGDHRPARIWTVMAYSGLRRSELAALTLRWLDLRAAVLRVPAEHSKSGEEEAVPLHIEARRAIRVEAQERQREAREAGRRYDQGAAVFGSSDIRRAWARALKRSRVDPHATTPYHAARHTFGTLVAAAARGDVTAVMAAGRWRSLSMVARYVHASAERARRAVSKL